MDEDGVHPSDGEELANVDAKKEAYINLCREIAAEIVKGVDELADVAEALISVQLQIMNLQLQQADADEMNALLTRQQELESDIRAKYSLIIGQYQEESGGAEAQNLTHTTRTKLTNKMLTSPGAPMHTEYAVIKTLRDGEQIASLVERAKAAEGVVARAESNYAEANASEQMNGVRSLLDSTNPHSIFLRVVGANAGWGNYLNKLETRLSVAKNSGAEPTRQAEPPLEFDITHVTTTPEAAPPVSPLSEGELNLFNHYDNQIDLPADTAKVLSDLAYRYYMNLSEKEFNDVYVKDFAYPAIFLLPEYRPLRIKYEAAKRASDERGLNLFFKVPIGAAPRSGNVAPNDTAQPSDTISEPDDKTEDEPSIYNKEKMNYITNPEIKDGEWTYTDLAERCYEICARLEAIEADETLRQPENAQALAERYKSTKLSNGENLLDAITCYAENPYSKKKVFNPAVLASQDNLSDYVEAGDLLLNKLYADSGSANLLNINTQSIGANAYEIMPTMYECNSLIETDDVNLHGKIASFSRPYMSVNAPGSSAKTLSLSKGEVTVYHFQDATLGYLANLTYNGDRITPQNMPKFDSGKALTKPTDEDLEMIDEKYPKLREKMQAIDAGFMVASEFAQLTKLNQQLAFLVRNRVIADSGFPAEYEGKNMIQALDAVLAIKSDIPQADVDYYSLQIGSVLAQADDYITFYQNCIKDTLRHADIRKEEDESAGKDEYVIMQGQRAIPITEKSIPKGLGGLINRLVR
jgi:hypothetical protein